MTEERKIEWEDYKHNFQTQERDEDDDDDEDGGKLPKILQTPFGFFRVDDTLNPFKQFRFYLANTSFRLTKATRDTLNKVDGIEVLIFLTRYKFIVAVAKLFDPEVVKKNVERALITTTQTFTVFASDEHNQNIAAIQKKLDSIYTHWVIYAFPNGNLDYFGDLNIVEVVKKYRFYKSAQVYSRGLCVISQELEKIIKNEANKQ